MSFDTWQEREKYTECYGTFFAGLLEEALGIVNAVESRNLLPVEAKSLLKKRFESLMETHVPETHVKVEMYRERIAAEAARAAQANAAYHEHQQKMKQAEELRQKQLAEATDRAHRAKQEEEDQRVAEHRAKFQAEQAALQAERDEKISRDALEARKLIEQIEAAK